MMLLRKSTATIVAVGPFLAADGATPVTSLTEASSIAGRAISNGTGADLVPLDLVHDGNGHYTASIAAGDVPNVGRLRMSFSNPAVFLPVWEDFMVLSPQVYDSLFGIKALSTFAPTDPVPIRNQDAITAPTYDDAFLAAWQNNFGPEDEDDVVGTYVKKMKDGTIVRSFVLTIDDDGNPIGRA